MFRVIAFTLASVVVSLTGSPVLAGSVNWHLISPVIGIGDLNNVRNNFGSSGLGDFIRDGIVDIQDLNYVRNHFHDPSPDTASHVIPEFPSTLDDVRFYLNYGEGDNDCTATVAYGRPTLHIEPESFSARVVFEPVEPGFCPSYFAPVQGLDGSLGQLAAGSWTFGIAGLPLVEFEVIDVAAVPEPSTGLLAMAASSLFFAVRGRRAVVRWLRL